MPWLLYYVAKILVRMLLLFTRYRVGGEENIPGQGALLVVSNHLSVADPLILGLYLGRRVAFMAKQELFRSRLSSRLVRMLGAFPVERGKLDRQVLRRADQALAQGRALVMFPEGKRSQSVGLQPASRGSALIALRSGVPVLPVGITGTEKIKGLFWILKRPQVTVNIGPPFYLPPVGSRLTRVEMDELTRDIMEHIAELLPPEYRGNYAGQGD